MENSRRPYYRIAEQTYRRALRDQLRPLIEHIRVSDPRSALDAVELIQKDRVEEAYDYVYRYVGSAYASREYARFAAMEESALRGMFERYMSDYVAKTAGKKVTAITGTTKHYAEKIIQNVLSTAEPGIGIDKLSAKLHREIKKAGGQMAAWRAQVIARTEVVTASNMGQQIGAEAVGMAMTKRWLATGDMRTRDVHLMADGQEVPMDGYFTVGGEKLYVPGDGSAGASAGNIINCRCAVVYNVAS